MALSAERYSAGVYTLISRDSTVDKEYILDNQRYTLRRYTMLTIVVENNLLVDDTLIVNKIGNNKNSIIGNTVGYTN